MFFSCVLIIARELLVLKSYFDQGIYRLFYLKIFLLATSLNFNSCFGHLSSMNLDKPEDMNSQFVSCSKVAPHSSHVFQEESLRLSKFSLRTQSQDIKFHEPGRGILIHRSTFTVDHANTSCQFA